MFYFHECTFYGVRYIRVMTLPTLYVVMVL